MQKKHLFKECIEKNSYKVVNCTTCGYWHVHPMPTNKEIISYYEKIYYTTLTNNRSMTDKLDDPDGFYTLQYEDSLRSIKKILNPSMPLSVLDIGAGYGDFLRFMFQKGWKTQGLELAQQAYERIPDKERLHIKYGDIDSIVSLGFEPTSVVILNNVLEHLREPANLLKIIKQKLLLAGGIIFILVPNDFSVLQDVLMKTVLKDNQAKQYFWVIPPEHLNYWSIKTFKKFIRDCGFKIINVTADFPMEIFPLMGEDYIAHPELGRTVHLKRVHLEKKFYLAGELRLKELLFKSFADIGIGRDGLYIIRPK